MKAQQFAIGESLTVEDLAEDQVGGQGVGFVPSRLSAPRSCAWGHHSSFFSASQNILLFILVKLGDAQAGWDQTIS